MDMSGAEAEGMAEEEAYWWLQTTDYPWDNTSCDALTCGNASALANASQRVSAPQLHAIDRIQFWVTPALVAFGCLGNVVSVWVFHSTKLRTLSSSCYLAALAASDTAFLLTLFLVWLSMVGYDLLNQPGWCQAINYAIYVSTFLSVWLVVAFTVERFIAVCYPLLRAAVCTVRRARLVILLLTLAALLLYSYLLVAAAPGVHTVARRTICKLRDEYVALATAMNYVDTVLTLLLPVATVVTLNVRIARCVWHVERLRHSMTLAHAPHTPAASLCPGGRGSQPPRVRSQNKVTKMLLIISTVFILLNLPSYVMRAYIFFWCGDTCDENVVFYTLQQTFTLLFYTNFAINFLLYCATGQNFRRAVAGLCKVARRRRRRRRRHLPQQPHSSTASTRFQGSILDRAHSGGVIVNIQLLEGPPPPPRAPAHHASQPRDAAHHHRTPSPLHARTPIPAATTTSNGHTRGTSFPDEKEDSF